MRFKITFKDGVGPRAVRHGVVQELEGCIDLPYHPSSAYMQSIARRVLDAEQVLEEALGFRVHITQMED